MEVEGRLEGRLEDGSARGDHHRYPERSRASELPVDFPFSNAPWEPVTRKTAGFPQLGKLPLASDVLQGFPAKGNVQSQFP